MGSLAISKERLEALAPGVLGMSRVEQCEVVTLALEALEWRANVEAMLGDGDPNVVRAHPSGGAEDLIMSLVLTMGRTRNARKPK